MAKHHGSNIESFLRAKAHQAVEEERREAERRKGKKKKPGEKEGKK